MKFSCKDCGERRPGCHAECARYLSFREERERRNEERLKKMPVREFCRDSYARTERPGGCISFSQNRRRIEQSAERRMKAYAKAQTKLITAGRTDGP